MKTNLIIQGAELATQDLKQLAKLSSAARIEAINQQAFRLVDADPASKEAVAAHCKDAQLDYGFMPQSRKLTDFGLVVMDMDSTLITIECIDEIADMMGLKPQVAAITASAMRGEIDFQASLRKRVGLLDDLPENALERVYQERLRLSSGAETFLSTLKSARIKTLLVSGGFTFFTSRLKDRLHLDYTASNQLEIVDGKLTGKVLGDIVDADAKAAWLIKTRDQLGLSPEQVIAIGDGANDLKMMAEAGVSIAYRAKAVVQEKAGYALNFVGLDGVLPLLG
ncbi:MAG TPA: phosphoserine phosphatase SerB [Burkholderiales bacterium]|nr:phosphoserine phosphatase SerB [Burkholderiales bacterium]